MTKGTGGTPKVVLYTRAGCHLCDVAKAAIDDVRGRVAFEVAVVDVDADPARAALYGTEVPVVFVNGKKAFKYRVDPAVLERRLREGWPDR